MNKEIKTIVKKTARVTGVTCLALGGAALIASGAALKALTEGALYLKERIENIVSDRPESRVLADEAPTEAPAEEAASEEAEA